jgi:predicted Na+-dependent transporter
MECAVLATTHSVLYTAALLAIQYLGVRPAKARRRDARVATFCIGKAADETAMKCRTTRYPEAFQYRTFAT